MKMALTSSLIAGAVGLAGCAAQAPYDTSRDQQAVAAELGTRVAGPTQRCLPSYLTNDMIRAGGRIIYRSGGTLYLAQTTPGCESISDPSTALVVDYHGGSQMCDQQVLKVVDTATRTIRGVCSVQGFTPYTQR